MRKVSDPFKIRPEDVREKDRNRLVLKQIGKDNKVKWQMVWMDTRVPFTRFEDITDVIHDFLDEMHKKR